MTVIRGYGEVEAIVNGVVSREIARLQRIERERIDRERKAMIDKMSEGDLAKIKLAKVLRKKYEHLSKLAEPEKRTAVQAVYESVAGMAIVIWYKITRRVI